MYDQYQYRFQLNCSRQVTLHEIGRDADVAANSSRSTYVALRSIV